MMKTKDPARQSPTKDQLKQVNFRIDTELSSTIKEWCADRGIEMSAAFKVGIRLLMMLDPLDRDASFAAFRQWKDVGYPSPAELEAAASQAERENRKPKRKPLKRA